MYAFSLLTDGVRFEFFLGIRGENQTEFTRSAGLISEEFGWMDGWSRLSQLLQQSD